jgi:hypothetical protein
MNLYVNSTISVSRKEPISCTDIAKYLSKSGIKSLVRSNISTQPQLEYGCQIIQSSQSKHEIKNVWELLRNKYRFQCAHVKVGNSFEGCILDFIEPSKCGIGIKNCI